MSVPASLFVLNSGSTVSISSGYTLTVGNGVANGVISGSGILAESGAGNLLDLNGNNTYSGGTVISGGTVSVTNVNASGISISGAAGSPSTSGGTLLNTGTGAQTTAKADHAQYRWRSHYHERPHDDPDRHDQRWWRAYERWQRPHSQPGTAPTPSAP